MDLLQYTKSTNNLRIDWFIIINVVAFYKLQVNACHRKISPTNIVLQIPDKTEIVPMIYRSIWNEDSLSHFETYRKIMSGVR